MPLPWNEIKDRALKFFHEWADESSEDAEAKSFWDAFFTVFGVPRRRVATFEQPVRKSDGHGGFIDLLWKGILLVEHKSRGKDLDRAFQQAKDYFHGSSLCSSEDEGLEPKKETTWVRPFIGSEEFINGIHRYCLWLKGISANELQSYPWIMDRLPALRPWRLVGVDDPALAQILDTSRFQARWNRKETSAGTRLAPEIIRHVSGSPFIISPRPRRQPSRFAHPAATARPTRRSRRRFGLCSARAGRLRWVSRRAG
jgi:hypothetical protein